MPIVVDGNNLLHALPHGSRSRAAVRRLSLELVRRESMRLTVVFDGPPPAGTPERESLGRLTVVYSGSASADDLIVGMLPQGGQARSWSVVTDDGRLGQRARHRGARVRPLAEWSERLLARPARAGDERLSEDEVAEWEAFFAGRDGRDQG